MVVKDLNILPFSLVHSPSRFLTVPTVREITSKPRMTSRPARTSVQMKQPWPRWKQSLWPTDGEQKQRKANRSKLSRASLIDDTISIVLLH